MNICACFLKSGADFQLGRGSNWLIEYNVIQGTTYTKDDFYKAYVASLYWSVVTITTVGYGDIVQTQVFELLWAILIIVFGVSFFVTYLGELASLFSELTNNRRANEDRLRQINELDSKFNIGPELVEKL